MSELDRYTHPQDPETRYGVRPEPRAGAEQPQAWSQVDEPAAQPDAQPTTPAPATPQDPSSDVQPEQAQSVPEQPKAHPYPLHGEAMVTSDSSGANGQRDAGSSLGRIGSRTANPSRPTPADVITAMQLMVTLAIAQIIGAILGAINQAQDTTAIRSAVASQLEDGGQEFSAGMQDTLVWSTVVVSALILVLFSAAVIFFARQLTRASLFARLLMIWVAVMAIFRSLGLFSVTGAGITHDWLYVAYGACAIIAAVAGGGALWCLLKPSTSQWFFEAYAPKGPGDDNDSSDSSRRSPFAGRK